MTQFVARTLGDGKTLVRSQYERTFGRSIDDDFGELLAQLKSAELIEDDGDNLVLSARDQLIYDLVMLAFFPKRARDWLAARQGRAASVRFGVDLAAP